MPSFDEAAADFLAQRRVAVAGVSRRGDVAANAVYRRLRTAGYDVFAVNPHADEVEGDPCYPDLASIPGGVGAVVVATHPAVAADVVREAADLGVRHVWFHRGLGPGSVDAEAVRLAESLGLDVIAGGCPLMFLEPVDVGHRCIRWVSEVTGRLPAPAAPA